MTDGEITVGGGYQEPGSTGHELVAHPGKSEGFVLGKSELGRICKRLRAISPAILSNETWAATLLGAAIALLVAWAALPAPSSDPKHENHLSFLHGAFLVSWIFAAIGTIIFGSLAIGERRRQGNGPAHLIADELEEICVERMKKQEAAKP
jgi:hypothetical protein